MAIRRRTNSEPLHSIPEELIVEILLNLPVKSLLRFRSVSKAWRSLISSPNFIKSHLDRTASKPKNNSLIIQRYDTISLLPLTSSPSNAVFTGSVEHNGNSRLRVSNHCVRVVGCCNGLVCLRTRVWDTSTFIWNPATRRSKQLPSHSGRAPRWSGVVSLGFGCDSVADDYKVVRIVVDEVMPLRAQVEVYSNNADSWKRISNNLRFDSDVYMIPPTCNVVIKGIPYWNVADELISFDVGREVFRQIKLPEKGKLDILIVDYKDSLAVMMYARGQEGVTFWMMVDGDWTKKLTIGLVLGLTESYWLLGCSKDGNIVAEGIEEVLLYDSENRDFQVVRNPTLGLATRVHNYTESLISIRGSTQVQ